MAKVLLIDTDIVLRQSLEKVAHAIDIEIFKSNTIGVGLQMCAHNIDVVMLEKVHADGEGNAHIQDFLAWPHKPHVLLVTHLGNGDIAERALRAGAWEFLCKPVQPQELVSVLQLAMEHRKGRGFDISAREIHSHDILGSSRALQEALNLLHEAARSETNVLIYGETGVGKELFARALHENSLRKKHPFVTVDCASLTENLVESHLFGHARGAFTGADKARDGLLLTAHTGTLFLDEVGELPMSMQKVFLRALELRRFRPVGLVEEIPSDFRLIAATNKELAELVKEKEFRNDLLYRLQGVTVRIPPLRERKEDVFLLAENAVKNFCKTHSLPVKVLNMSCIDALMAYVWPGNVRELISTMERACIMAKDEDELYAAHLPTDVRVAIVRSRVQSDVRRVKPIAQGAFFLSSEEGMPTLKEWKKYAELTYINKLLEQNNGDVRLCATQAGLSRGHFYELLKKHNISI